MRRSRLVVALSLAVLAVGSALALGAWYLDPARAAAGPLPAEGLSLPAGTRVLMGLDVRQFVQSPLYRGTGSTPHRPESWREIEQKTGLNPERDLDLVVVAAQEGRRSRAGGLVLVKGSFDRYRVARAIEKQGKQVTWQKHEGNTLYVYREGSRGSAGLAFLSDDTFVFGDLRPVMELLSRRADGAVPLRENARLLALLDDVTPGAAFWMVGDESALSHLPSAVPGGAAGALPLAALKTVVVSGELEPLVSVEMKGEAADAQGARSLADVVRGFVALAQLQAQNRPELAQLANAVSVTAEGSRVRVSARFSYESLEALQRPFGRPSRERVPGGDE